MVHFPGMIVSDLMNVIRMQIYLPDILHGPDLDLMDHADSKYDFILMGKWDKLDHVAPDEIFDASSSIAKKGLLLLQVHKEIRIIFSWKL